MLEGRRFDGRFLFDDGVMIGAELDVAPPPGGAGAPAAAKPDLKIPPSEPAPDGYEG